MSSSRVWVRSSRAVDESYPSGGWDLDNYGWDLLYCGWDTASDFQCKQCNCPGLNPSILRHNGICGTADEAVLNKVLCRRNKNLLLKDEEKLRRYENPHVWGNTVQISWCEVLAWINVLRCTPAWHAGGAWLPAIIIIEATEAQRKKYNIEVKTERTQRPEAGKDRRLA